MKLAFLALLGYAAYQYDKKQISEGEKSIFSTLKDYMSNGEYNAKDGSA